MGAAIAEGVLALADGLGIALPRVRVDLDRELSRSVTVRAVNAVSSPAGSSPP